MNEPILMPQEQETAQPTSQTAATVGSMMAEPHEEPREMETLPDEGVSSQVEERSPQADSPEETQAPVSPASLESAPAAEKPRAEESPELTSPALEPQRDAKRDYWRSVLTGDPATVPTGVREQAGVDEWELPEEQREYRLLSTVNRSWAADHLPRSREEISAGWQQQRAELAERFGVQDSEHELFLALSQNEQDAPRREAAEKIFNDSYLAGLDGKEAADVSEYIQGLDETDAAHARALANMAIEQGRETRLRYSSIAQTLAQGLDAFAAVEENAIAAPRMLAAAPHLIEAIDALAEMDDTQRRTVLYLAAGLVRSDREGKQEASLPMRAVQAIRRGASRMSTGMIQALSNVGIATLNGFGRQFGSEGAQELSAAWDKRMRVFEELRKLSQDELRPLVLPEESGSAASYLITAAEATPAAALSCCGGAGFAALTLGAVGESVAEARQRAPMASQELQLYAGLLGGAIQAGIYMNLNRIGGRLLEQSISRLGRAAGQGVTGYTLAGLNVLGAASADAAKMLAAGKLAHAADMGAQELAARLSNTASNIDWKEFGENLTDIEANMHEAAALLPFLLLGSGRVALQHFRSPRAILGDGRMLEDWGISHEQQESILAEQRPAVRSQMMREALVGSRLWSGLGSLKEVTRALRLLHSDAFKGFSSENQVRDFLQLPPMEPPTAPKPKGPRPYKIDKEMSNTGLAEAMQLMNEWWSLARNRKVPGEDAAASSVRSGVKKTADVRSIEAYDQLTLMAPSQLPKRIHEMGVYAPRAEQERRVMLRDRVADINSLSYQFLMTLYTVDSIARDPAGAKGMRVRAERSRKSVVGALARAVTSTLRGVPRDEALGYLNEYICDFYKRRKYKAGQRLEWLTDATCRQLNSMPNRLNAKYLKIVDNTPEFQAAYRVMTGLRANADALIDIVPRMQDFQTALTRGLSPDKACEYVLTRALNLEEGAAGVTVGEEIKNVTPMREYFERNDAYYRRYRELTGIEVEEQYGDDGEPYLRVRRPDGSYTHWHRHLEYVINDLVGNASLQFMPFLHKQSMASSLIVRDAAFSLLDNPVEDKIAYSTYDQLSGIAMRDLGNYWMERLAHVQPGLTLLPEQRRFIRSTHGTDGTTPILETVDAQEDSYGVRQYTYTTPMAMIEARHGVHWRRMISSGFITPEEAADYMHERGFIDAQTRRELLNPPIKPIYYWRDHIDPRKLARQQRENEIKNSVADKMAEYTTIRFLAALQDIPAPQSLREWVSLAALCPTPPPEGETLGRASQRITIGKGGTQLISWTNRHVARRLRFMSGQVSKVRSRESFEARQGDVFQTLLRESIGLDDSQSCEQGWVLSQGDEASMQGTSQALWNLLRFPVRGWERMGEDMRGSLREYLKPLCESERLFMYEPLLGGDRIDAAMRILEETLADHPELHRYSDLSPDGMRVKTIRFDELPASVQPGDEPLYSPLPLYEPGPMTPGCSYHDVEAPEYFRSDLRIRGCLRLLDELRSYPRSIPQVYANGIWWHGERYGVNAKSPEGLEDYEATTPLLPVIEMLSNITEEQGDEQPLKVCGVDIYGIQPETNFYPLLNMTVYRMRERPNFLYRLMPGDPDLRESPLREPYLVHCREGVYLNGRTAVKNGRELESVYVPLKHFSRQALRDYAHHGDRWSAAARQHILKSAVSHALHPDFEQMQVGNKAQMLEFLMRVVEDSGFSSSMEGYDPSTLSLGQARVLSLASDLITCVFSASPQAAYERLKRHARLFRDDVEGRAPINNALHASRKHAPRKKEAKEQQQKGGDRKK